MKKIVAILIYVFGFTLFAHSSEPLRVAVAGVTHAHINTLMSDLSRKDIQIVGVWDLDTAYVRVLAKRFGFPTDIIYHSLDEMLDKTKPEAVAGFGSIHDHLGIVEAAAPRGVHVMVEKPLGVSTAHANKMAALARKYGIEILTNYETTWYPTHAKAYDMAVNKGEIGGLRKVIVYDGHAGPSKMGSKFTNWLMDPVGNGGGAVIDFGCYGANLTTWLLKGERPTKVYADIRNHQPDIYTKVDDDATILVSYGDMEAVINASWGWPFDRKDIHIYGSTGYIFADNKFDLRYRNSESKRQETKVTLQKLPEPMDEPFRYFKAVIRGEIKPDKYDLSSLENNLIVVEILEAAQKSAKSGRAVILKK